MSVSLEEQTSILNSCGILMSPEITIEHLLQSNDREAFENDPFLLLLCVMGGESETEPFINISDNIWHFDTECIEDHNAYVAIAQRFVDLAGGDLPLENITD